MYACSGWEMGDDPVDWRLERQRLNCRVGKAIEDVYRIRQECRSHPTVQALRAQLERAREEQRFAGQALAEHIEKYGFDS